MYIHIYILCIYIYIYMHMKYDINTYTVLYNCYLLASLRGAGRRRSRLPAAC